jgi:multidrug efflux system membrane fusion protein
VSVAQAVSKTVPLEIQAVGNVEAFSTITVKAQIGGELTQVNFQEGADVKKGDRLFVIDPRPYESQVAQAEANLAKDRAQLQLAQANLARDTAQETYARSQSQRYTELAQKGVLSKDSAEQTNAQATAMQEAVRADSAAIDSARANIAADQAALDRAKLQLEYCTITSPIDGRTGHLLVKQGNIIKPNDVDLITINQLRPIFVTFAIPETNLPTIQSHMARAKVSVAAYSQSDDALLETGTLTFVKTSDQRSGDPEGSLSRIRARTSGPANSFGLWSG